MLILCKIQCEKFINDMYNNEYLYFNWLGEFRSKDSDNSGRLDPRELNTKTSQLKNLKLKVEGKDFLLHEICKEFKGQFIEHLADAKINSCSLHWLEVEFGQIPTTFNDKLLNMGDKMLLIYDWQKFFEILDKSVEELGYQYSRKKLLYYDPTNHNGELTLHHKDNKFEYQNEYRILIAPTNQKAMMVYLPGLKSISQVVDTNDYMKISIKIE
ncbi:hypothetical protein [Aquirufa ecclesiirivi]|nr:hypothetical protein [Aquirufa ecclesiirivi]